MHFLDLIALRVVKEGLGSWAEVMTMSVEDVMDAFHFACFQNDYSETFTELNRHQ